jgi:drug/metabolite transporter (DMT)-like permease
VGHGVGVELAKPRAKPVPASHGSEGERAQPSARAVAGIGTPAALVITLLLWSSAFAAIRAGLKAFSPAHLALLRFLVASATLALCAVPARLRLPERRDLPALAMVGLLGVPVYHVCLNIGEVSVTAGSASMMVNTAPVFTALLAALVLRDWLKAWGWIGMAVSFCGTALLALGEGKGLRFAPGAVFLLIAAVGWSVNIVIQKPLLRRYSALEMAAYSIWIGTFFMLVFLPGFAGALRAAPLAATMAVVYLGVFPAAIAYGTWAYVLSRVPASRAASLLYLVPALAVLVAWAWLREIPTLLSLAGGALALTGVAVVNTKGR